MEINSISEYLELQQYYLSGDTEADTSKLPCYALSSFSMQCINFVSTHLLGLAYTPRFHYRSVLILLHLTNMTRIIPHDSQLVISYEAE